MLKSKSVNSKFVIFVAAKKAYQNPRLQIALFT